MRPVPTRFEVIRKIRMTAQRHLPLDLMTVELDQLDAADLTAALFQDVILSVDTLCNLQGWWEKRYPSQDNDFACYEKKQNWFQHLNCVVCVNDLEQFKWVIHQSICRIQFLAPIAPQAVLLAYDDADFEELDLSALPELTCEMVQQLQRQTKKIILNAEQYCCLCGNDAFTLKDKQAWAVTGVMTSNQFNLLKQCKPLPHFLRASICIDEYKIDNLAHFEAAYRVYSRGSLLSGKPLSFYDFWERLHADEDCRKQDANHFLSDYVAFLKKQEQYTRQLLLTQDLRKAILLFYDMPPSFKDQNIPMDSVINEINQERKKMSRKNEMKFPTRSSEERLTADEILHGKALVPGMEKSTLGIIDGETYFRGVVVCDDLNLSSANKERKTIAACDFGNASFQGSVNFTHTNLQSGFWFFKKSVNLQGAVFSKTVNFSSADIRGVNFKDTQFKENITLDYQTKLDDHTIDAFASKTEGFLIFTLQNGVRVGMKKGLPNSAKPAQCFLMNEVGVGRQLTEESITALYSAFKQEYANRKQGKFFLRDNISKKLAGIQDAFSGILTVLTHAQGDPKRRTTLALNAVLNSNSDFSKQQCKFVEPLVIKQKPKPAVSPSALSAKLTAATPSALPAKPDITAASSIAQSFSFSIFRPNNPENAKPKLPPAESRIPAPQNGVVTLPRRRVLPPDLTSPVSNASRRASTLAESKALSAQSVWQPVLQPVETLPRRVPNPDLTSSVSSASRRASTLAESKALSAQSVWQPVLPAASEINTETQSQQSVVAYYIQQPISLVAGACCSLWAYTAGCFASETSVEFAKRFFITELYEQKLLPKIQEMTPEDESFNTVLRAVSGWILDKVQPALQENPDNNTIAGFFKNTIELVKKYQKQYDFDASSGKSEKAALIKLILDAICAKHQEWEKRYHALPDGMASSVAVFSQKPV